MLLTSSVKLARWPCWSTTWGPPLTWSSTLLPMQPLHTLSRNTRSGGQHTKTVKLTTNLAIASAGVGPSLDQSCKPYDSSCWAVTLCCKATSVRRHPIARTAEHSPLNIYTAFGTCPPCCPFIASSQPACTAVRSIMCMTCVIGCMTCVLGVSGYALPQAAMLALQLNVVRLYVGAFITSLDTKGVSISLMPVDKRRLAWLDAPTQVNAKPLAGRSHSVKP